MQKIKQEIVVALVTALEDIVAEGDAVSVTIAGEALHKMRAAMRPEQPPATLAVNPWSAKQLDIDGNEVDHYDVVGEGKQWADR